MKNIAPVVLLAIATAGCSRMPQENQAAKITLIAMEPHECFWRTCPHYRIVLRDDGSADYTGFEVVRKKGNVALRPGPKAFRAVEQELKRLSFFELRPTYAAPKDGCTRIMSDQSSVQFSVTRGGQSKTVFLYYGCEGVKARDDLAHLAATIDREAGLDPLLGRGGPL